MKGLLLKISLLLLLSLSFESTINQYKAKFFETSVIQENFFVDLLYSMSVRSQLECSKACVTNYECRAYMYCYDPGTKLGQCYQYQYGEQCVAFHDEILNIHCSCHRKGRQFAGGVCYSPIGYYGNYCESIIRDCTDGKSRNISNLPIRSFIQPTKNSEPFEVLCDFMEGMVVIQHRSPDDDPVNFNRTWSEYVDGFGKFHAEFWLGLEKIKTITDHHNYTLEIILTPSTEHGRPICVIQYDNFQLDNRNSLLPYRFRGYKLFRKIGCPTNDDIFKNDFLFSTFDKDINRTGCAAKFGGGLWYNPWHARMVVYCNFVNLNGPRDRIFWQNDEEFFHISTTTLRLKHSYP